MCSTRTRRPSIVKTSLTKPGFALVFPQTWHLNIATFLFDNRSIVVDGILGVIPEFEGRFGCFESCDIVRPDFQVRRQIVKQSHLVAHIQMLDRVADFLNRAHACNLARTLVDAKSKEQALAVPAAEPTTLGFKLKREVCVRSALLVVITDCRLGSFIDPA